MPVATDQQVQKYVDDRLRRRAEDARALIDSMRDDKGAIDDIYAACVQANPTWTDQRNDGPPRLLTTQDVLVYNAIADLFLHVVDGTLPEGQTAQNVLDGIHSNWAAFQSACVRPVNI